MNERRKRLVEALEARRTAQQEEMQMPRGYLFPFATLSAVLADTPEEPNWILDGYIAKSVVTLLGGRWKVGKSTFLFALLHALQEDGVFVGRPIKKSKVLLLSEERPLSLNEKAILMRLSDSSETHLLMRHQTLDEPWPVVVAESVAYCMNNEIDVLVIDTWDKFAGGRNSHDYSENSADDILRSIKPVLDAAGENLAVLIVTHQRKSAGKHGEAIRGSSALLGAVDIIVELERASGEMEDTPIRILHGTSRFVGTPERLTLEWDDTTGIYKDVDFDTKKAQLEDETLFAHVTNEWVTRDKLTEKAGMRASAFRSSLKRLLATESIARSGKGMSGDPYLYALPGTPEKVGPEDGLEEAESEEGGTPRQASLDDLDQGGPAQDPRVGTPLDEIDSASESGSTKPKTQRKGGPGVRDPLLQVTLPDDSSELGGPGCPADNGNHGTPIPEDDDDPVKRALQ